MIIGILSDTHDRVDAMAAGMRALLDAGAEYFIHCGDIGSQRCLDLLAGLPCAFVFGNCDFDRVGLARYAASIDVPCYGNFADLTQGGKRIAVTHGDDYKLKQRLIAAQEHDYFLQGHTHIRADQKVGKTRLINPGALHRAPQKTVATLDTSTDALQFHIVEQLGFVVMKRIVITGGPGSGKTVITAALVARHVDRFALVPEAATQVYTLLQTRWDKLDLEGRRAAQRQMFRLQREQETRIAELNPNRTLLLDRGTVDGAAYWPDGPDDFWRDVDTTREQELTRYDAVILLDTCARLGLYDGDNSNFCRFEDADAAIASTDFLKKLWAGHPHLHFVDASPKLEDKIVAVDSLLLRIADQPKYLSQ